MGFVTQYIDGVAADTQIAELLGAVRSGVLELVPLHAGDTDQMVEKFVDTVLGATADPRTYPLFDDQTGNLVRLAIEEGAFVVSKFDVAMAKDSGLAADFLGRLPSFDAASIDEVVDIRRELARPLLRFRSAVTGFSEKIVSAPWDRDFPIEAGIAFRKEVEPALLEIEDAVKSQHYVVELASRVLDKPAGITTVGSMLAGVVAPIAHLPHLASLAFAGGAVVGAANVVQSLNNDRRGRQMKVEQNRLFFYFAARERLARRRASG